MGTLSRNHVLPTLIALAIPFLIILNAISSVSASPATDTELVKTHEHDLAKSSESDSSSQSKSILKRQAYMASNGGSSSSSNNGYGFGFHTSVPTAPIYHNTYDNLRGNGLNYPRDPLPPQRDNYNRDYYASPSSYAASSSGRNNYYNNDRDRQPYDDYNFRDRQPYDDYRYNRNYQRDPIAAAANSEFAARSGQLRHEEYQKRTGQGGPEFYDPFYFIGSRNGGGPTPGQDPIPLSPSVSAISASSAGSPFPSTTAAVTINNNNAPVPNPPAPLRNRRNSHLNRPNDFYNEINGGKYDIMTKSAYPMPDNHHYPQQRHRLSNHHLGGSNQFLTREQLFRQHPDMRVPYPSNHIDHYGASAAGQPWSVRIGTQLKVNDDGNSPNPTRFYVRDEADPTRSRSRYPIY